VLSEANSADAASASFAARAVWNSDSQSVMVVRAVSSWVEVIEFPFRAWSERAGRLRLGPHAPNGGGK